MHTEPTSTVERELRGQLRAAEEQYEELADFFENGSIGLHCVDADGIVRRVNQAELELLDYKRKEYIGRHTSDFHVDVSTSNDILKKLIAGQTLRNYLAGINLLTFTRLD